MRFLILFNQYKYFNSRPTSRERRPLRLDFDDSDGILETKVQSPATPDSISTQSTRLDSSHARAARFFGQGTSIDRPKGGPPQHRPRPRRRQQKSNLCHCPRRHCRSLSLPLPLSPSLCAYISTNRSSFGLDSTLSTPPSPSASLPHPPRAPRPVSQVADLPRSYSLSYSAHPPLPLPQTPLHRRTLLLTPSSLCLAPLASPIPAVSSLHNHTPAPAIDDNNDDDDLDGNSLDNSTPTIRLLCAYCSPLPQIPQIRRLCSTPQSFLCEDKPNIA